MKNIIPLKLNILNSPIKNYTLIEASAGTGKTFSIALIYVRIILQININKNKIPNNSIYSKILLLTYTNQAVLELQKKIFNIIHELKKALITKKTKKKYIKNFFKYIHNTQDTINLLQKIENHFHNISLFTIHSFFLKIIKENHYLFNQINNFSITNNIKKIYLNATYDFWRQYCYTLPYDIMKIIYSYCKNPEDLLLKIYPLIQNSSNFFKLSKKNSNALLIHKHFTLIKKIQYFKKYLSGKINQIKVIIQKIVHKKNNIISNKILSWINDETKDYFIPKEILHIQLILLKSYSLKKEKECKILLHKFIDFNKNNFSIKKDFLSYAVNNIKKNIKKIKINESQFEFDDLINFIYKKIVIKKNYSLMNTIRNSFPIAIIDECQDIDKKSNDIFFKIYNKQKNLSIILIGDPKQTIYEFRGANLSLYQKYKKDIHQQYFLNTNWRSSPEITKNINFVFSLNKNSFLNKYITYKKILTPKINYKMFFKIKNIVQPAFRIFFNNQIDSISLQDYYDWSSKQCAEDIYFLMQQIQQNTAKIFIQNKERLLSIQDITILVRNKNEALIIENALKKKYIDSYYCSNQKSIFNTQEAEDILIILESLLSINKEKDLNKLLLTRLIHITDIYSLQKINNNKKIIILNLLHQYLKIWNKSGFLNLIKYLINKNIHNNNILITPESITNYLHLGEIIDKKNTQINKKNMILSWLQDKMINKQQINNLFYFTRNYINTNSLKIISIHQSKGLEFPLIWIPFSSSYSKNKIYSLNRSSSDLNIFLKKRYLNQKNQLQKNMSEEIRLLYVAMTRSILHCSFTIAPIAEKKNDVYTTFHKSGLGYLITSGKKITTNNFKKNIQKLFNKRPEIEIFYGLCFLKTKNTLKNTSNNIIQEIKNLPILNTSRKNFIITSYSNLIKKYNKKISFNDNSLEEYCENNKYFLQEKLNNKNKIDFTLQKGIKIGNLIHKALKIINFNKPVDIDIISNLLKNDYLPIKWIEKLQLWLKNIINTPLTPLSVTLNKLNSNNYIKEFEFYISVKNNLNNSVFNKCIQKNDKISLLSSPLKFHSFSGIITGYIDLIFKKNNKYFIVDYKSTWLGESNQDYNQKNIEKKMILHRYDIQYHIYSIALHRYLKQKINNYSIKKNFGGIFYLFLRAMHPNNKNPGIFFIPPNKKLINNLNIIL
ncbi:RecBCD enzyme subunit RecB [Buchnera aphidicola (Thelaxes suberi)]|uniref:exodeoxyribonuclease V subunit beta n=1 Tax=Buchnera aphidicola TaxID=9 RepID=UPI003464D364